MAELANSSLENASIQTPEQKLWRAVLSQGVYEACSEKSTGFATYFWRDEISFRMGRFI